MEAAAVKIYPEVRMSFWRLNKHKKKLGFEAYPLPIIQLIQVDVPGDWEIKLARSKDDDKVAMSEIKRLGILSLQEIGWSITTDNEAQFTVQSSELNGLHRIEILENNRLLLAEVLFPYKSEGLEFKFRPSTPKRKKK